MLLKNKIAVIYGGGGAVGATVAKAFAQEGATVYLAGRTIEKLAIVAQQITQSGGVAHFQKVDALDKEAVENHLKTLLEKEGTIDISFNVVGYDDVQGSPLTEMEIEAFKTPIDISVKTHFVTATTAARMMQQQGSGIILALTANVGYQPYENVGSFGILCATLEAFCRQLAVETGRYGIRVVCLRSAGSPDAPGVDDVFNMHAANAGISREAFENDFAQRTMLKRLPKLKEIADAAVLMASDKASAVTAAVINVTCGEIAD
jgi:NAD(P)-dependent dehydrogenase (short-subunit alcohol dehydrogenase family)